VLRSFLSVFSFSSPARIRFRFQRVRGVTQPQQACRLPSGVAPGQQKQWQNVWTGDLQDPMAYRLRDIRDCGLSESFYELSNLF
jgi:hypothetical protein